jgi:hypothetical protein
MKRCLLACALLAAAALWLPAVDAADASPVAPATAGRWFVMVNSGNAITVGPTLTAGVTVGKNLSLEVLLRAIFLGFLMTSYEEDPPIPLSPSSLTFGLSLSPFIPLGPGRIYIRPQIEVGETVQGFSLGLAYEGLTKSLVVALSASAGYRWNFSRNLFLELGGGIGIQAVPRYVRDYVDPQLTDAGYTVSLAELPQNLGLWGGIDLSFGVAF